MRKIELEAIKADLPKEWIADAKKHLNNMIVLDLKGRKEYIKGNTKFWGGDIKRAFWLLGNKKCWYSEVEIELSEAEIEHFRPKNKVGTVKHDGYWWLAFNWRNFRLSYKPVNSRSTSDRNGELVGKGTYFPLASGARATNYNPNCHDILSIGNERPQLIDPINGQDVSLLSYDFLEGQYEGEMIVDNSSCLDDLDFSRAEDSITHYALNDGKLVKRRFERYVEIEVSCSILDKLTSTRKDRKLHGYELEDYRKHYDIITRLISPNSEFSSMAKEAVKNFGDRGWTRKILTTV